MPGTEGADQHLIEALFDRNAEVIFVPEVNHSHNAPEVVDPVRVVERHAPAARLGREAAQEQDACAFRQERRERVLLCIHDYAKIAGICGIGKR